MVARNKEHFLTQGLYYPETRQPGDDGHHNLAWELTGDDRFRPEFGTLTDLAEELRRARPTTVLLSSEDLSNLHAQRERLVVLSDALEDVGYSVLVVIVLRDPCEYLESLYAELQYQRLAPKFEQYVADAVAGRGTVIDYRRIVGVFASVFGLGALRVLAYDADDAVSPVLAVCRQATGTTLSPVAEWPRFNVRSQRRLLLNAAQRAGVAASVGDVVGELVAEFRSASQRVPSR